MGGDNRLDGTVSRKSVIKHGRSHGHYSALLLDSTVEGVRVEFTTFRSGGTL